LASIALTIAGALFFTVWIVFKLVWLTAKTTFRVAALLLSAVAQTTRGRALQNHPKRGDRQQKGRSN
jgi:hypothetical protein